MEIFISYYNFKNKIHLRTSIHEKFPLCGTRKMTSIQGDMDAKKFLEQPDEKGQVCKSCRKELEKKLIKK